MNAAQHDPEASWSRDQAPADALWPRLESLAGGATILHPSIALHIATPGASIRWPLAT
jgi:hypothetical protein